MINDSKNQAKILRIKQDLSVLRQGKIKTGRKIPDLIRREIIKLHHLGWSVSHLEQRI